MRQVEWNVYLTFRCKVVETLTNPVFQVGLSEEGIDWVDSLFPCLSMAPCYTGETLFVRQSLLWCDDCSWEHFNYVKSVKVGKLISYFTHICYFIWTVSTVHMTQKYSNIKLLATATYSPFISWVYIFGCCPLWRIISSQLPLIAVCLYNPNAHGLCEEYSATTRSFLIVLYF